MKFITDKDKERIKEIASILLQIKDESMKDQLVGAAKWAAKTEQPQKTA